MNKKFSVAAKKRRARVPKKVLSEQMRRAVNVRWAKTTKKQRREYAMKLVEARKNKKDKHDIL